MDEKPTGPIWVDLAPTLMSQLSIMHVIEVANLAMNRLSMRDWAEIFGEIGIRPEIKFLGKEEELQPLKELPLKALVWIGERENAKFAQTPFGKYHAYEGLDYGMASKFGCAFEGEETIAWKDTMEEAKAVAEADYLVKAQSLFQ